MRARWREDLGIEIVWEVVDFAMFEDGLRQEPPQMFLQGWAADYPDPDSFLRVAFPRDVTGWQNDTFDGLVESARRVMDPAHRLKLYAQADRILMEDAVVLPLVYGRKHLLIKPWVRNYNISEGQGWKDVVIEPH